MKKVCSTCAKKKPESSYTLDKHSRDGLSSKCRDCQAEYRAANREKIRGNWRKWRSENRESEIIRHRCDYDLNGNEMRQRMRDYYEQNREVILAKQSEYAQRNKEAIRLREKKRRLLHRDEINRKRREASRSKKATPESIIRKAVVGRRVRFPSLKNIPVETLLKISVESMVERISSLMSSEMTWENHGTVWRLLSPCPLTQATDEEELTSLFCYINYVPCLVHEMRGTTSELKDIFCQSLLNRPFDDGVSSPLLKSRSSRVKAADFLPREGV